jgi:RHS repeat-associated protein
VNSLNQNAEIGKKLVIDMMEVATGQLMVVNPTNYYNFYVLDAPELVNEGYYHFGFRVYDPEVGVWLSTDPAEQFWDTYSYTGGNPVNLIDLNGMLAKGNQDFINLLGDPQGPYSIDANGYIVYDDNFIGPLTTAQFELLEHVKAPGYVVEYNTADRYLLGSVPWVFDNYSTRTIYVRDFLESGNLEFNSVALTHAIREFGYASKMGYVLDYTDNGYRESHTFANKTPYSNLLPSLKTGEKGSFRGVEYNYLYYGTTKSAKLKF